jgi:hypothetical protein
MGDPVTGATTTFFVWFYAGSLGPQTEKIGGYKSIWSHAKKTKARNCLGGWFASLAAMCL